MQELKGSSRVNALCIASFLDMIKTLLGTDYLSNSHLQMQMYSQPRILLVQRSYQNTHLKSHSASVDLSGTRPPCVCRDTDARAIRTHSLRGQTGKTSTKEAIQRQQTYRQDQTALYLSGNGTRAIRTHNFRGRAGETCTWKAIPRQQT